MLEKFEPEIVVYCCHNSYYGNPFVTGQEKVKYPSNIKIIEVSCSGKIEVGHLLKAFEQGADGVYVVGCPEGECHFLEGNLWAKKRIKFTKDLLGEIGLEIDRLEIYNLSSLKKERFMEVAKIEIEKIKKLGPNPLKK